MEQRRRVYIILYALLVLITVFNAITTYKATFYALDSDAASEMILSNHLNQKNALLSKEWFYSTELRVLNTQLVFAPLFSLFPDWHIVRFAGTLILQAILVLSYIALCKSLKCKIETSIIGIGLLLLPTSIIYGIIVLYQGFYIPHISISFFLVALFVYTTNTQNKKLIRTGTFIIFLFLSLLSGMGGVRQVITTHIPLTIVILWNILDPSMRKTKRYHIVEICVLLCSFLFYAVGFFLNRKLAADYIFADYSSMTIGWNIDRLSDFFFALFQIFGLRSSVDALSMMGVLSVLGVFATVALIVIIIQKGICEKRSIDNGIDVNITDVFIARLFIVSAIVILMESILIDNVFAGRYLLPFIIWFVPFVSSCIFNKGKKNKITICFVLFVLFINGIVNSISLIDNHANLQKFGRNSEEHYDSVKKMEPLLAIVQNDYDLGYGTFWESNILTEMSNGTIPMINVSINGFGNISYFNWLMLGSTREIKPKNAFIVIGKANLDGFKTCPVSKHCSVIYNDPEGEFVAYKLNKALYIYETLTPLYYAKKINGDRQLLSSDYSFQFDNDVWIMNGEDKDGIRILREAGLSYGPYMKLYPGKYLVRICGAGLDHANISVTAEAGKKVLQVMNIKHLSSEIAYILNIQEEHDGCEVVVANNEEDEIKLSKLIISQVTDPILDTFSYQIVSKKDDVPLLYK